MAYADLQLIKTAAEAHAAVRDCSQYQFFSVLLYGHDYYPSQQAFGPSIVTVSQSLELPAVLAASAKGAKHVDPLVSESLHSPPVTDINHAVAATSACQ